MKQWIDNIQARIIDTHTIMLGNGSNWVKINLPWVARDIAKLLKQACFIEESQKNDQERVAAIRLVISKLQLPQEKIQKTSDKHLIDSVKYYRDTLLVKELIHIPSDKPVILASNPIQLLSVEHILEKRQKNMPISIISFSFKSVIVGPILQNNDYCLICFRYMLTPFITFSNNGNNLDDEYMLNSGIALARTIDRDCNDVIIIHDNEIKIIPYAPFIGCPLCFPR